MQARNANLSMDFGMLMRKCMCLTLFFPDVTTTKSDVYKRQVYGQGNLIRKTVLDIRWTKPPFLFLLFLFGGTMTINDVKKQCKN